MTGTPSQLKVEEQNTLQINEQGKLFLLGQEVTDLPFLQSFYRGIQKKERFYISKMNQGEFLIEAFDQILVVQNIEFHEEKMTFSPVEGIEFEIDLNKLYLDDWDRFLGRTTNDLAFVLSKKAHEQLFSQCDFDDDSITYNNNKYLTPHYYNPNLNVNENQWWTGRYNENPKPGWDLEGHHSYLETILSTLKLPKSRILVLGCGNGHDAAYFASLGHIVTAVDFSEVAISNAKKNYPHLKINWVHADYFQWQPTGPFDIVFDHTNYCAIEPSRRKDLVKLWKRFLVPNGYLLGIFFSMDKQDGPPFGGSEWELHKRIEKDFRAMYWNRIRSAPKQSRYGLEFMVYLEKLS